MKQIDAPELVKNWMGCFVMSRRAIGNAYLKFPEKTIFRITSEPTVNKHLISKPCKCCGVAGKITIKSRKESFLYDFYFVEMADEEKF